MAVLERLSEADTKKYAGQWVAVKDGEVVFAAPSPEPIVAWLRAKQVEADLVFAVPTESQALSSFY
ncbi:MAG: DUF5678 domain-containing protein [Gemmatimonadota bacterium]|nr:DUF5678 domain-containing protein [Gemmatimonadota bacterium]